MRDLWGLFSKEKGYTVMGSLIFLAFSRSKWRCSWIVLKSGTPCEIFGIKVQSPTLPVEAVLLAALFWESYSCRSIILWTPSGRSNSVFLFMIYSKILYLRSNFCLLILLSKFTSQYHGIGLATNLYYSPGKSQWGSVDFGSIKWSETRIWLIIYSLNL